MYYKKKDLEILNKYYSELERICRVYEQKHDLSYKWNIILNYNQNNEEEAIITNTYINS